MQHAGGRRSWKPRSSSIARNGLSATTLATVAEAAGLSQGVTVFYFKSKQALLAEALRWHYEEYRTVWRAAFVAAPEDPVARIVALVRADFDPAICNRRTLTLWYAFWGEATARPMFASISEGFDRERAVVLREQCEAAADLLDATAWTPSTFAIAIDALTDGLWIHMHLELGGDGHCGGGAHRHPGDRGRIPVAAPGDPGKRCGARCEELGTPVQIGLNPRPLKRLT